jgi:hypothetical protein
MIGVFGVGSRFEADDSLSVLEMNRVDLVTTRSNPAQSSLKNNCTVLGVELKTTQVLRVWVMPDLDLGDLSLLLAELGVYPVVFGSLSAAICTIPHSELVLNSVVDFINGDKVVVVAELVGGWELSVLLALEWPGRIRESRQELTGLNLKTVLNFFDFVEKQGFGLLHEGQEDVVVIVLVLLQCLDVQLHLIDQLLSHAHIINRQQVLTHQFDSG